MNGRARLFRTADVARIAELSLRQLQLWEERRFAVASRQGRVRVYDTTQTLFVMLAAELRRRGISCQKLLRISGVLRVLISEHRFAEISGQRQVFLLTDGRHLQVADSPNRIAELVSNLFEPFVCINVSNCLQRIHKATVNES